MNKRKTSRLIIIFISVFIVSALYVLYRVKKKDFLQTGLPKMVDKKTNSLYEVTYDSISVDELAGNMYIKNLHVKGDTSRQVDLIARGDTNAQKIILDIFIPMLQVVNFKTARALLSKQLKCERIIVNDPKAIVYIFPGQSYGKDEARQQKELYQQILGSLKWIEVENVDVNNSDVVAIDYITKERKFSAQGTNVLLRDVLIDSTYQSDTSRTLFCKEIKLKARKVILGERNNTAHVSNVDFNTTSKIVTVGGFDYDAYKNNGVFKTSLRDVYVDGMDWNGPVDSGDLKIRNIVLKTGVIETSAAGEGTNDSKINDKILTGWIKKFSLEKLFIR